MFFGICIFIWFLSLKFGSNTYGLVVLSSDSQIWIKFRRCQSFLASLPRESDCSLSLEVGKIAVVAVDGIFDGVQLNLPMSSRINSGNNIPHGISWVTFFHLDDLCKLCVKQGAQHSKNQVLLKLLTRKITSSETRYGVPPKNEKKYWFVYCLSVSLCLKLYGSSILSGDWVQGKQTQTGTAHRLFHHFLFQDKQLPPIIKSSRPLFSSGPAATSGNWSFCFSVPSPQLIGHKLGQRGRYQQFIASKRSPVPSFWFWNKYVFLGEKICTYHNSLSSVVWSVSQQVCFPTDQFPL